MGEDIPLNHYMKCTEHYLACGVSYAGHLANICKSNPDETFTAKNLDTILKIYPCLIPLHVTKIKNCLNALDLPIMMLKKILTTPRGGLNQLSQNKGYIFNRVRIKQK